MGSINAGSVRDGSTESKQDSGNVSLASLDSKTTAVNTDSVTVVASALPAGAAIESKQDAGNTSLSSINTHVIKADTDTVTVVVSALPSGGSTSALQSAGNASLTNLDTDFDVALSTRASESTLSTLSGKVPSGLTVSSTRLLVDNSGVTQPVSGTVTANQGGTWNITNVSGTITLPTGSSTEATLSTLNGKVPSNLTVTSARLLVDGSGVTQPVSGTVTANAGTGTFTVGQATGTNLHTVIDSGTITANAGTGNFTVIQGTGTNLHVVIDSGAITIPTGASTSALQTSGNASLASIDTDIDVALSTRASLANQTNGTQKTQVVDGSGNVAPSGDTVGRAQFQKVTDGTNTATVKAASTAAVATDTAIVVAISPNNQALVSSKIVLTAASPAAATVGTSTASAIAANANRKGLVVVNTSINRISLGIGAAAVLNSGITLFPGDSWVMDEYNFTTAVINGIAGAASSNLAYQEFT